LGGGGGGGGGGAGGGAGGRPASSSRRRSGEGVPSPSPKIAAARSVPPRPVHPGARAGVGRRAAAAAPPPRAEEGTENTKKRTFPCFGGSRDGCLWVKRCVSTERGGGALAREKRVTKRIRAGRGWGGGGGMGGGVRFAPLPAQRKNKRGSWLGELAKNLRSGPGVAGYVGRTRHS
jgi:hypothetical protein